jgi:hypothetical protein
MDQKSQKDSKAQNSKARQARQARPARKSGSSLKSGEDPTGIQAPNAPDHRGAAQSTGEYTVRSFLDARYMFSEDVDPANAILPGGTLITHKSLTYALHVKIDWDGVDTEGNPYKPTWEVADKTTLDGSARVQETGPSRKQRLVDSRYPGQTKCQARQAHQSLSSSTGLSLI